MKKTVKKTASKKSVAKKPVMKSGGSTLKAVPAGNKGLSKLPTAVRNKMGYMKSGGPKRTLKKYQIEGEVIPPVPTPTPTPAVAAQPKARTFADAYAANIAAGLKPAQARKIAMRELGLKKGVDSGAVIGAAGQIGSALINTLGNRGGGGGGMMGPPDGPFKKGGAKKSTAKKPMMKYGGAKNVAVKKTMTRTKKK